MADLEELFSRLKTQGQPSRNALADPRVASIWENKSPASASPTRQLMPRGATEQSMSNNLLTLLNINRPQSAAQPRVASAMVPPTAPHGPHLDRKTSEAFPPRLTGEVQSPIEPPPNTQRFLLDLLTKPAIEKTEAKTVAPPAPTTGAKTAVSSMPAVEAKAVASLTPQSKSSKPVTPADGPKIDAPQPNKAGLFNYVNPFDQLHASSPLNLPATTSTPTTSFSNASPSIVQSTKEEFTQEVIPEKSISVSEKLERVGEQVGKQIDDALSKASDVAAKSKDEDVTSNWSTAEDDATKAEDVVESFTFPMKPFVMLQLQGSEARSFRSTTWNNATPVARLKKDFSHDDRVLATASPNHIVYAVAPTEKKLAAGLKVIRQDDGKNKHIWSDNERLCSVQISHHGELDTILATGVHGTIFYAGIPSEPTTLDGDLDGFIMSPPPNSDEPSVFGSSSAIRTRAKLSNRHPQEYFAVARGRQIHLLSPRLASDFVEKGTVNTDKLLGHTSLSINTGKASKDFCFSEDDTVIASFDKAGRVKFWDIRIPMSGKVELKDPMFGFAAGSEQLKSDDKMSPSSITFIDKERAFSKGLALRYVLVGYQQNHVLQLWDLGLQRCVQEMRLPEGKELCSLIYHPKTAIIAVGHPGRNSVYFIHVSAPKYNLHPMDQATYINCLAKGDGKVPRPDSTAIMSGVCEFSCSQVGQLRSLDVLKTPYGNDETLFELYLMHSKGVLGIPITRADLGWDAKGKLLKSVDAVECGIVVVNDLVLPAVESDVKSVKKIVSEPARTPLQPLFSAVLEKPSVIKQETVMDEFVSEIPIKQEPVVKGSSVKQTSDTPSVAQASVEVPTQQQPVLDDSAVPEGMSSPATKQPSEQKPSSTSTEVNGRKPFTNLPINLPVITPESYTKAAFQLDTADNAIAEQFEALYIKLDSDRRIAEAAGAAKQDAMLRLVSSTLTDNVESSLHRIVAANIEQQVLPVINTTVLGAVDRSLSHGLQLVKEQVDNVVQQSIKAALNDAKFIRAITSEVSKQLTSQIQSTVRSEVQTFQSALNMQLAQHNESIQSLLTKHAESKLGDNQTLKALQDSEKRVTELLSSIQNEQYQLSAKIEATQHADEPVVESESEIQHLTSLLDRGEYEQATIEWLQSSQQIELFDDLFVRVNPAYLKQVSPLVALSVSATVTASFNSHVATRLEWLSSVLNELDTSNAEIRDVTPKILDVLIQRLQGAYMQIAESRPTDQDVLRKLASLNRQIGQIRATLP